MTSISVTVPEVPEVFTAREIADAAGVSAAEVRTLITNGAIRAIADRFVAEADAIRAVRHLRRAAAATPVDRPIFGEHSSSRSVLRARRRLRGAPRRERF